MCVNICGSKAVMCVNSLTLCVCVCVDRWVTALICGMHACVCVYMRACVCEQVDHNLNVWCVCGTGGSGC